MHYVTRFMEGLKPAVRVVVGIQQPPDLDTAYQLALLHEELGVRTTPIITSSQSSHRVASLPLPLPPNSSTVSTPMT